MKRTVWTQLVVAYVVVAFVAAAEAQPPGESVGPPGRAPGQFQGGGRPPRDPIREALDANHDHQLDADEIRNASAALLTLDRNGDGIVGRDDIRPPLPPGGQQGEGRGVDRGPPQERGGPGGPDGSFGPGGGGPRPQGGRGGPRAGAGAAGSGGPRGGGPSPERFVDRMMAFDADGDGKLGREELLQFAEQMRRPRGGPGAPPGPGPDGERPEPPPPSE